MASSIGKASGLQAIAGVVLNAIGTALWFVPGFQGVGAALQTVGTALAVSAVLTYAAGALTKQPEAESNFDAVSPTYGFNQWQNRVKGDSVLPVVYSGNADGHKIAPIYVQAYATPKGEQDDDFSKVLRAKGQGISALLAICEGPIEKIEDIRLNDEPVFEKIERKHIATGNGSKTRFTFKATRALLDSFEVYVADTLKGWKDEARTFSRRHTDTTTVLRATIDSTDPISTARNVTATIDGTTVDTNVTTGLRPHVWMASPTEMRVDMQTLHPSTYTLGLTYYARVLDGFTIEHDGSGEWTLNFTTAPASGAKIEVTFLRKMFNGLAVDWRNGADHQLNLPGFESIRNTYSVNTELTSTETSKTTDNEVDNVIVTLSSSSGGFTQYDDEGNRDPVKALFTIEIKRTTSLGGYDPFRTWVKLYDPAGKKKGKSAAEFQASGDSIAQLFFTYSIRGLIQRYYDKNRNSTQARRLLQYFTRSQWDIRIKRTNAIEANSNVLANDNLYWQSYDEVIDEKLSYPGVAMLGLHAVASDKLQGSAPNVTCRVRGIRDVEAWNGSAWAADVDNQGNPIWATIDLLTSRRFGAGDHFTKASNVDTTTALAVANWLDESVNLESGGTEARARLDIVLDTRKSPIQWAMDILRPHRCFPVLQGNTWRFVKDDAVTLADVPVVYEDTTAQRVVRDSVRLAHDSVARLPTELQTRFLDEEDDFESREIWIAPPTPTDDRRITQADLSGIVRRSEATRSSNALYKQLTAGGLTLEFVQSPGAINYEAGDVIRFISSRMSIDGYWRVARMEYGTADYFVRVQCLPYIPAVYGQQEGAQGTQRTGATSNTSRPPTIVGRDVPVPTGPSQGSAGRRNTRVVVNVRRAS